MKFKLLINTEIESKEISGLNQQSQCFILLINVEMPKNNIYEQDILLINVEMPTMVGILTFMSEINFMLS